MPQRVLTVAPMPPEKCAYALARYSRSPDSIRDSLEWVRTHDSQKFLESFYFQYGHASIADLGHLVTCFEGVSEIAAIEIEDEQLWDGQARSSRYQNFAKSGVIVPPELSEYEAAIYLNAAAHLIDAYNSLHGQVTEFLAGRLPRPESMKEDAYRRNIAARAFDVARYVLFLGVPTGVGQVTSIRTLERQIRRLKASRYAELRSIAEEIGAACASPPACPWNSDENAEPIAPTLARHVDTDLHLVQSRDDLAQWAAQNLPGTACFPGNAEGPCVDLMRPGNGLADAAATLLYPVTTRSYRNLYEMAVSWSDARRNEVVDVALKSRTRRDELLAAFRGGPYVYDLSMDIGAYRDLHRHRRCQQVRQAYGTDLGFDTPALIAEAGLSAEYEAALNGAFAAVNELSAPGREYLLPFATRARFLFRMDFAEAEYICRVRSGVKGHFSYRQIAWQMKNKMLELEPHLGRLIEATPPWIDDPLNR